MENRMRNTWNEMESDPQTLVIQQYGFLGKKNYCNFLN